MAAREDVFLKKLGSRVKQHRRALDMSQEVLGGEAGAHRTFISHLELGQTNVSVLTLRRIARVLGVKLTDLLSEE